jgi:hypothetical protein
MEVLGSAKRWQWVFDVFSIFDSVCSWFLSMIWVLSVQKVIFFNRNLMFLFAIIGDAVMKLEFNACL